MLFVLDSVEDLFCRGFTQSEILQKTGVDIGYHGSKIRDVIRSVSRYDYYIEFVRDVIGVDVFKGLLYQFADGDILSDGVYSGAGLGSMAYRLNLGKVCESLGVGDIWADIRLKSYDARFDKIHKTMKKKYGHEYPYQCPVLAEKAHATMKKKYGAEYTQQVPELRAKCAATTKRHYGVENSGSSPVVQEKRRKTMKARHGAEYPLQVPVFKVKQQVTMTERHGAPFSLQSPSLKAKIDATVFEKYGVSVCTQHSDVKAKVFATNMSKYGVGYYMQSTEFRKKAMDTKRRLGKFSSSDGEDKLYVKLVAVFGEPDVIRQYNSSAYPYDCDFYIKSRDMYIELNAFKSHGRHWFGVFGLDSLIAEDWKARIKQPDDFYDVSYEVWTERDVEKRATARKNGLNYVVFWDSKVRDAELWFAMGCPDGQDWDRMYSWLPERDLFYDGDWPEKLTTGSGIIAKAARMANWRVFYEREIALWNQTFDLKWGSVQARLYANRMKYFGKLPDALTNRDILQGLGIAGICHGYSPYNNSGIVAFLEKYRPSFVYDPCAGWGERMLTCAAMGVQYLGVDINKRLMPGYRRMMKQYNLSNVGIIHGDSSRVDLSHGRQDCVFTCPPYEGLELYSDMGAENLSHDDFIKWWQAVVTHSVGLDTKIFAYQVNQSCKQAMNQALLDSGWRLDCVISVNKDKVSHLVRAKGDGKKHDFEEIQVFVR